MTDAQKLVISPFDPANYLDSEEDCRMYLAEFFDAEAEEREAAEKDVERARLKPGFVIN